MTERATATHTTNGGTTDPDTSSSNTESEQLEHQWRDEGRPIRGWLYKRHTKDSSIVQMQWAWRFFSVDDVRGTLSYSKSEKKKPSAILPLADINNIKPLEGGNLGATQWCFLISCPPVHFTVRARDVEERDFWLNGLAARAAKWRAKLNPGAVDLGAALSASADNMMPRDGGAATSSGGAPRAEDERANGQGWGAGGGGGASEDHWSDKPPSYSTAAAAAAAGGGGAVSASSGAAPAAQGAAETVELDSDDEAARAPARPSRRRPGEHATDLHDTQHLAEMLSSDEDVDEVDLLPAPAPAPASCACAAARTASSPGARHEAPLYPCEAGGAQDAHGSVPSEAYARLAPPPAGAALPPPPPFSASPPLPSAEVAAADPMPWLSAMPDSAFGAYADPALEPYDAPPPPPPPPPEIDARPPRLAELGAPETPPPVYDEPPPPPMPIVASAPTPQPIALTTWTSWDSHHGEPAGRGAARPSATDETLAHSTTDALAIAVGAGIVADNNFVDENWDDE